VRSELEEHGLSQVLLNAPAGDWAAGERGLGGLPDREDEFVASIEYGLAFAREVGSRRMHVMAGTVAAGADADACWHTLVRRLRWASGVAAEQDVSILVEPLNAHDFPGYLVPDARTALAVLDAVDAPNMHLQLDLYHVAMAAPGGGGAGGGALCSWLETELRTLLPHAAHVQLANPPGRNEPSVGDVDFAPLLALLDGELRYDGYVGCEYKPSTPTTDESLAWAERWLAR
jgi:hydroxypyruvate isomerase